MINDDPATMFMTFDNYFSCKKLYLFCMKIILYVVAYDYLCPENNEYNLYVLYDNVYITASQVEYWNYCKHFVCIKLIYCDKV